jgi:hypothetical protein
LCEKGLEIVNLDVQGNQNSDVSIHIAEYYKRPFDAFESLRRKDRFNMADHSYAGLHTDGFLNGVSIGEVKKVRSNFKDLYPLEKHTRGVYYNLRAKLKIILPLVYAKLTKSHQEVSDFKLKFCVDGTNVGNNRTYLNFNFSILNEEKKMQNISWPLYSWHFFY